ncbi:SDR family NAD(P)-dependent oxidoreductase [Actinacidiphila acidipaludis]|uniref:SDR family oxidoreductase n=1 Tax=Actinacidiphila acidipaludis TaxID=2873382 RepID=A0ABS7QE27_9ACTN|nr:SDR family oxidoreductase [Streptomyces acidipaludis]MBY8881422.1 SDR family oxidoreductase [Streptomyces acidipaludis]
MLSLDLSNRTALVTGSTAGIGRATAQQLATAGARVYINGRTEERVQTAIADIRKAVPDAELYAAPGDVSTGEGVQEIIRVLPETDILVNNAGTAELSQFTEVSDESWQRLWDLNVMSGVRLSRHYVAGMADRGWGRIIFVSSESALVIPPQMVHYGATKTAQLGVARGLAEAYPASGITVNSVLPGPTRSELVERYFAMVQEQQPDLSLEEIEREHLESAHPGLLLGRFAECEEVANLIAYLASPLSTATNGAALRVDGGALRNVA